MNTRAVFTQAAAFALVAELCGALWLVAPARAGEPEWHAHARARDPVLKSGEDLARRSCSACHVVAADQEIPPLLKPPATSFEEIANRPETTVATVRHYVLSAHYDMKTLPAGMPNLMLTSDEATTVARYLLTLRRP